MKTTRYLAIAITALAVTVAAPVWSDPENGRMGDDDYAREMRESRREAEREAREDERETRRENKAAQREARKEREEYEREMPKEEGGDRHGKARRRRHRDD